MKDNTKQKEWLVNTIGKIVQYEVSKTAKNLDNLETIIEYEVRKALKSMRTEIKNEIKRELISELRSGKPTSSVQPQSIKKSNPPKKTFNSNNGILNELLNSTKPLSKDEIAGSTGKSVLDLAKTPQAKQHPLSEVFSRDYTELVRAMDKTTDVKPKQPAKAQNPKVGAEREALRNNILNTIELQPFDEDDSWLNDVE